MSVIVRTRINSRPAPFGLCGGFGALSHILIGFAARRSPSVRTPTTAQPAHGQHARPRPTARGGVHTRQIRVSLDCVCSVCGTSRARLVSAGLPQQGLAACSPGAARGRQLGGYWLQPRALQPRAAPQWLETACQMMVVGQASSGSAVQPLSFQAHLIPALPPPPNVCVWVCVREFVSVRYIF